MMSRDASKRLTLGSLHVRIGYLFTYSDALSKLGNARTHCMSGMSHLLVKP